jgi:serine/threonine-protein kinase
MSSSEGSSSDQLSRPGLTEEEPATAPPPLTLQPGNTLGQYRILGRLGAGGMGEVFKAVHRSMDRVVALKILAPHHMRDERARLRFQREVRSAARLTHPHIVTAHDADEDGGVCFLVMEYVEGTDLSHCTAAFGPPSLPVACEIIRQAALGLQHAHEKGMVHRDIKPANLMVTRASAASHTQPLASAWPVPLLVKILDFGLARLQFTDDTSPNGDEFVTREGTVIGTPEFMAPEQATNSRYADIRSDIYSLGCTFYFLLAGRPPFVGHSAFEILARHLNDAPRSLEVVRPEVPPALATLVNRMLAKRPEDRFQTPAELVAALQPWAQSASLSSFVATTSNPVGLDAPPTRFSTSTETSRNLLPTPRPLPSLPARPDHVSSFVTWIAGIVLTAILAALLAWLLLRPSENASKDPLDSVISGNRNVD